MVVCFVCFCLILYIIYFYCYVYVFLLLCMFCSVYSASLCCYMYCLCVNKCVLYYCHRVLTQLQLTNKSYIYIYIYHISTRSKSSTRRLDNAVACISHVSDAYFRNSLINIQTSNIIPYPTAFPYGNGMVLHFYQQQESSTTKTVHKVINKGLKTYVYLYIYHKL